ncbi:MAG: hypothetical protein RR420_01145 [Anaerovoracaceae bacterium]
MDRQYNKKSYKTKDRYILLHNSVCGARIKCVEYDLDIESIEYVIDRLIDIKTGLKTKSMSNRDAIGLVKAEIIALGSVILNKEHVFDTYHLREVLHGKNIADEDFEIVFEPVLFDLHCAKEKLKNEILPSAISMLSNLKERKNRFVEKEKSKS